jgi:hypothetical protein
MSLATASIVAARRTFVLSRRMVIGGLLFVLGLLDALVFGYLAPSGHAVFTFTLTGAAVTVPSLTVTPRPVSIALGAVSCVLGAGFVGFELGKVAPRSRSPRCSRRRSRLPYR